MIIIVIVRINLRKNNSNNVSSEPHVKTVEEKQNEKLEELKKLGEVKRMQYYVSEYISYLQEKRYDKAYNVLYDEFKSNYFKTQEEFENYVKNKYSDMITIDFEGIERFGTYYVLKVHFMDVINFEKSFIQLFVVKENGFDDFVLSFQAE